MTDLDALDEVLAPFITHPVPQPSGRLRAIAKIRRHRNKMKDKPLWLRQLQTIKAGKARHGKGG